MRSIVKIDAEPVRFIADSSVQMPVMVCSHERSGTHFLINSIAANSCFSTDPFLNYDLMPLGSFLNFYDRNSVKAFFARLVDYKCASIVKSHFACEFFLDQGKNFMLSGMSKILYVVRNPVDVMLSYHRFINYFPWQQGPKIKQAIDFLNAAPEGQMLRYQSAQGGTILDRWKLHLLGWLRTAAQNESNILVIRYEDLDRNHEFVVKKILSFLNVDVPEVIIRPERMPRTIHVPEFKPVSLEEKEKIRACIVEKLGDMETIRNLFPELYEEKQISDWGCTI
jgi:hypothetical protein